MNSDDRRWAERARELGFNQLEVARRQAEAWRNGLTGVTALLGTVFIVKGRDDVTELAWWLQWWIAFLLVVAFASLIRAIFLALGAAAGETNERILLTGEDLREWTEGEVDRVGRDIGAAKRWTIAGMALIAMALLTAWLSPTAETTRPMMRVDFEGGVACGPVTFERAGYIGVTSKYGSPVDTKLWVPVDKVSLLREVPSCP
ncbi:MAG: hypothetical protein HOV77_01490 [Hamadaea sp.]|uniref:hypothetical protein n=1 Tax=Hamadaea sp. TaxID=2024425 RepID=UPI00178F6B46|nr:hypothetical protein [Hamadaea sp.]NUT17836.1 hypothetical protein [Hamadaea sp.]